MPSMRRGRIKPPSRVSSKLCKTTPDRRLFRGTCGGIQALRTRPPGLIFSVAY